MMRRIDLLPAAYAERRRERRNLGLVMVAGLVVLLLLVGWWFFLGTQIADAEDELAQVHAENAALQAQIDELQRFAQLAAEVESKRTALQTVMTGDIDWPAIMTEIAMVIPGEVWLTQMTTSAGATEGAQPVGTETNAIRVSNKEPFGRISFTGNSLTMPGVARWLIRLGTVREFSAIWLSDATAPVEEGGVAPGLVEFNSTLELSDRAASLRYQRGLQ